MRTLRIAVRTLLRRPSFAAITVLTLTLGLGATAAIFALVDEVVLDPLPYPEPEALVAVDHPAPRYSDRHWGLSEAGWYAFLDGNRTLEGLAVYERFRSVLGGPGQAEQVGVARVSANLFDVLRIRPALGRMLTGADVEVAASGTGIVGVLSHEYWQTRFGGDPTVVGRQLELSGYSFEVVGVLEAGASLPDGDAELWIPAVVSREHRPVNEHKFTAVGRLRAGIRPETAESDLRRILTTFPETLSAAYWPGFIEEAGFDVTVTPLREHVVGDVDRGLWILLAVVGLVLLIGCANVANLFLVRLESRRRERAVQAALGASRWDVARRSLAETGALMGLATAASLVLAGWALAFVLRLAPELPRAAGTVVDGETVLFTAGVAGLIALLLGIVPAIRAAPSVAALREGVGLIASRRGHAVRGALVGGEMALALVVLVGAGLMLRSFHNVRAVDPGFDPEGVLTVGVALPVGSYQRWDEVAGYWRRLTERVGALPDVAATGATTKLPLVGAAGCAILGMEDPEAGERNAEGGCLIDYALVTPGYFDAMGIPLDGTAPEWEDVLGRRGQIVASRPTADRLWPGEGPREQGVRPNGFGPPPYYRVTGIAGPVRQDGLMEPPVERVYFPVLPIEGDGLWGAPRDMTLVIRTAGVAPESLVEPVRSILAELDPGVAVGGFRPMETVVAESMARTTFMMLLLAIAAAVALALGLIGLYGVVAYAVEQRRSEIGIRMALGARAQTVRLLVVRQAVRLALVGALVGVVASLAASRVLASQLFEVAPTDPLTVLVAAGLLLAVAVAAAAIPAGRASRVQPMAVLRGE
jgi:predicted permease